MIAALLLAAVLADEPPAKPPESPLVKAAEASGGKRKPKSKVITNADVKKSGGKLLTLPPGKPVVGQAIPPVPSPEVKPDGPIAAHEKLLREREAAAKRVGDAEQKVADLEAESRRLEQAYYHENDPTVRDTAITEQFAQNKRQLDVARKQLADARDTLFALMNDAR
jgi:hypothetical protein